MRGMLLVPLVALQVVGEANAVCQIRIVNSSSTEVEIEGVFDVGNQNNYEGNYLSESIYLPNGQTEPLVIGGYNCRRNLVFFTRIRNKPMRGFVSLYSGTQPPYVVHEITEDTLVKR